MILSGKQIQKDLGKKIYIEPFSLENINSNSYNLALHNELYTYTENILDMKKENHIKKIPIPKSGLQLTPGKLYLGRTVEYTKTKCYVPMLEGRSSIGRLGLFIHITAGFGDVGFEGYWTLEIQCIQPIIIYPFIKICQIFYHTIKGNYETYSSEKYQKNTGIQPSLLYTELDSQ